MGLIFFRWDLKTPCIKNSEYKSHAKKKKKIPIVISTISHFWSPTLTNLWYSVFVSLFSLVYTPPYPRIFFFCGGLIFFLSYLVARGWKYYRFLVDLLLFWEKGAWPFSSIKPSVTNYVNSRTVDGKIIMCAC